MTTPHGKNDLRFSTYDLCGEVIAQRVRETLKPSTRILDVGAGWGKYRWLLPEYEMDAVEIWDPYVEACALESYYRFVFRVDVCDIPVITFHDYGGVIFGDVLEHIEPELASTVIAAIARVTHVWVGVPFQFAQGPEEGNPYEAHKQDDLTFDVMRDRYPALNLVMSKMTGHGYVKAVYEGGAR